MVSYIIKLLFKRSRGQTWLYTTGAMMAFRLLRKVFTKKEVVDLSKTKPGDKFIVEHLPITHAQQIKQFKKEKKMQKKLSKAKHK